MSSFSSSLVSKHNLCFIGLLESKKEIIDAFLVRKLWPNLDYGFDWVPSLGAFGGLLLIWNSMLMQSVSISKGTRWICFDFSFNSYNIRHILIYASNLASERLSMWAELIPLIAFQGMVFVSGDFNDILTPEERLNCVGYSASMLALRDFLNVSELIDLPLQGRSFTWRNSFSRSRIDRCLVSISTANTWRSLSLSALPDGFSDHVPILISSDVRIDWGSKSFRSVDAWWEHSEFSSFISSSWLSITGSDSSMSLIRKLKELRSKIRSWNTDVFGDQNKKILELAAEVSRLDLAVIPQNI
ncbi:uncharacterized protein LOC126668650 [Mercurialis annua]|uniref:uncharacterized protein LOC126668650 n=1 Tax=Mercurialis annua TaxID=3986 RepID=UPI00215F47E1|nr:uncharacterized protein LOC126668650 [Mercurialis annua]